MKQLSERTEAAQTGSEHESTMENTVCAAQLAYSTAQHGQVSAAKVVLAFPATLHPLVQVPRGRMDGRIGAARSCQVMHRAEYASGRCYSPFILAGRKQYVFPLRLIEADLRTHAGDAVFSLLLVRVAGHDVVQIRVRKGIPT